MIQNDGRDDRKDLAPDDVAMMGRMITGMMTQ